MTVRHHAPSRRIRSLRRRARSNVERRGITHNHLENSPQAKGRVERMNGTLQDRLVKTLRLGGVNNMTQANALLDESFLKSLNGQFANYFPCDASFPPRAANLPRYCRGLMPFSRLNAFDR